MRSAALILGTCLALGVASARAQGSPPPSASGPAGSMLLTVVLKHDQSKPLEAINAELKRNGYDKFPPDGVEVVSWYVVMGLGQVVTLRFPAERLREVNRVLEQTAWGGYRTEFYPTYDYKAAAEQQRQQMRAK